jgi:hypothetical protein
MKTGRFIARFILYASLVAAIVAAWVTVTVLKAPEPVMQAEALGSFSETIARETRVLFDDRADALSELESYVGIGAGPISRGPGPAPGTPRFENAQATASQAVTGGIFTAALPSAAGMLISSPELDEILDTADAMYVTSVRYRTARLVPFYTDAMASESDDYYRYLGYRTLMRTVDRDLIRYRELESLPFQESKMDLYRGISDESRRELTDQRNIARVGAEAVESELDNYYGNFLARLVGDFNARLMEQETGRTEILAAAQVRDEIRSRIAGFRPVALGSSHSIERSQMPDIGRLTWLAGERDALELYGEAASGDGSE